MTFPHRAVSVAQVQDVSRQVPLRIAALRGLDNAAVLDPSGRYTNSTSFLISPFLSLDNAPIVLHLCEDPFLEDQVCEQSDSGA